MNNLSSHFNTFLAKLQNIFLRSTVTCSNHASQCVTQPIYATVTYCTQHTTRCPRDTIT